MSRVFADLTPKKTRVQELREKVLTLESEMSGGEDVKKLLAHWNKDQTGNAFRGFPGTFCWSLKPIEGCMMMYDDVWAWAHPGITHLPSSLPGILAVLGLW